MESNKVEDNILKKSRAGAARRIISKYAIVFALIGLVLILTIVSPSFLTGKNLLNVLTQSSIYGIMALGMTLIIISKSIDLAAGSTVALVGMVAASLAQTTLATTKVFPNMGELNVIVPVLAAILLGAAIGGINGSLIAYASLPAFIATLGMQTIVRGTALMYTQGKPISNFTDSFMFIGSRIGWLPVPVLIYAICIAATWILLGYTRFGKSVYAIGGNINAARVSGINVKRNIVLIYVYAGFLFGIASLVFAGRVGSVHPGAATGYELTAIASTTIGGTSHAGGIGTVWGAVIGALILGVLRNGLTLLGVQAYWQQVVEGIIIIVAVFIDMRKHAVKN